MKEYYRVQANINLDAIRYNLLEEKKIIHPDTKMMAIIKADGYGHGAVPIAHAIDHIVDAYGVAIIEEALELRNAGITKPILILGYTSDLYATDLIENKITQTIFQYKMAKKLSDQAVKENKKALVQIKLDTGMNRLGFQPCMESIDTICEISKLPGITITGIFTHFACADITDKTSAYKQLETYLSFYKQLEERGVCIPIKHVANSAATLEMPEANLNMVRSGISTYGLYPSDEVYRENVQLQPAMELKSKVVFVKTVEKGIGIGYGSTFITKQKTIVATIPVGYADGYPRALSNKGRVLIHGKSAPIIGRVCMDQFMVDVTEIPNVKEGDSVTLVGTDGTESITVEELANESYSFNYEFVCDISKRVPRIYYQEGTVIATQEVQNRIETV